MTLKQRSNMVLGLLGVAVLALLLSLAWLIRPASLQASNHNWDASYWNNMTLSGTPVLQRQEANLNYNWGPGTPDPLVPADRFSARWTRTVNFAAGTYRFTATTDDGMRVWVNNALIIDSWWDSQVHSMTADVYLNAGNHQIKVEYYENGGDAVAALSWTAISGPAPVPIANWRGEYFNNITLSGNPVLVRDDQLISFDWGVGSPGPGVNADQFSVRWTRSLSLPPGRYRFTAVFDDGGRLWVNGLQIINEWHDSYAGTYNAEIDLPGGAVPVQVEYYENTGGAVARLIWTQISSTGGATWRGEYFNNMSLSGTPILVRDDPQIAFNWGNGSPGPGVNADQFSVRWSRSVFFTAGRYRFTATSDDGVRVFVNNQQVVNGWSDHAALTFSGDIDLPSGTFPVRVEYYENTGGAQVQFSWTAVAAPGPTPTPTPSPTPGPTGATGTVLVARLNVRSGPGLQYAILSQVTRGQVVSLAGFRSADANWVLINRPNAPQAWVSARPIYLQTSVAVNSLPVYTGSLPGDGSSGGTNPTATVSGAHHLNVRHGPGVSYGIVTVISGGTQVQLLGRNSATTWARIRLASGATGWVNIAYLRSSTSFSSLPVVQP